MFKKKRVLLLAAIVVVILGGLITAFARNNDDVIPQNQFGITQEDTFSVSDTSANGDGWYTITDFTQEEKIPILEFLAGLENEETLDTEIAPDEVDYDYPPRLYAYKQDFRIVFFLHEASNIEVREVDLSGHIKSRKKFEATEDAFETLYKRVGITDMETYTVL